MRFAAEWQSMTTFSQLPHTAPVSVLLPKVPRMPSRCLRVLQLVWSEARPVVQLIVGARFAIAVLVSAGPGAFTRVQVLVALLGWALGNTAVYLFNGLQDISLDQVNRKGRPLARGDLSVGTARVACLALAGASVLSASVVGAVDLVATVVLLGAGVLYSARPAALASPWLTWVLIGYAGCATYLVAAYEASGRIDATIALLAVVMATWMAGVGGILKDLGDVAGDRAAGRRTVAVLRGTPQAATVGAIVAGAVAIGCAAGAIALRSQGLLGVAAVLGICAAIILRHCRDLARHDTESTTDARTPYRLFMVGQYGAHSALLVCYVVSATT